jgi:hypothetical protein
MKEMSTYILTWMAKNRAAYKLTLVDLDSNGLGILLPTGTGIHLKN